MSDHSGHRADPSAAADPDAPAPNGGLLVVGATSGAGKSTVVAGLCRSFARRGASVAPFKAQNMSNHAAVSVDGGEVGRAQAMQAAAAGSDLETAMNPVLLKPTTDGRSHVVVRGAEVEPTDAAGWGTRTETLRDVVLDDLRSLRRRFDVVVAEGAGGAAEINLLDRDLVNLPLAAAAGLDAVLVVDIERGGAFAAAHGTVDLLPRTLRDRVAGIVFNRFRGDATLLDPGITALVDRLDVPYLGTLPHLGTEPMLGVEDSLDLDAGAGHPADGRHDRHRDHRPVRVGVVRLPHLANPSDIDPLVVEDDVAVRWVTHPGGCEDLDLLVVPGSRATVADLHWLTEVGLARAIVDGARADRFDVLGICAGAQMLGRRIHDAVEGTSATTVDGLGLLDATTTFARPKVVRRRSGRVVGGPGVGTAVSGYQLHFGRFEADRSSPGPLLEFDDGKGDGAVSPDGRVQATSLHGILDGDGFRAALLGDVAERRGRRHVPATVPFADRLDAQHERLADWVDAHLDTAALDGIVRRAAPWDALPGWGTLDDAGRRNVSRA